MYLTDLEKYKSSANEASVTDLPVPMPLYDEIRKGNVDFLLQAFNARKDILLNQIRKGGSHQSFIRWQACVEALEAVCDFLNKYKSNH